MDRCLLGECLLLFCFREGVKEPRENYKFVCHLLTTLIVVSPNLQS